MAEMDYAVDQLISAIKETREYQTYDREKEKVKKYPELKAQIDAFRIKNFTLQSMTEDHELFHKIEEFQREYEQFREDPMVADFLAAELEFCRMMQRVNIRVTAALDFE